MARVSTSCTGRTTGHCDGRKGKRAAAGPSCGPWRYIGGPAEGPHRSTGGCARGRSPRRGTAAEPRAAPAGGAVAAADTAAQTSASESLLSSYSTSMRFCIKSTVTEETPASAETARSTWELQAVQLMPVTSKRCFTKLHLRGIFYATIIKRAARDVNCYFARKKGIFPQKRRRIAQILPGEPKMCSIFIKGFIAYLLNL